MNMSMDKPIALINTEGTRGPQVKNAKKASNLGPQNSPRSYPQVLRGPGDDESIPRPVGSQFRQIWKNVINEVKFGSPELSLELPGG